ncbi:MAG: DNA topoisomerase (ATP-hydrolyzing) subunit A [Microcoleaceae cyanobacterium]
MAKQLNLLSGQVISTSLHTEMQQSYLEYAMSVIVGRALPDVRDGLKPVHRRILYAMHELGLTPDRPYRKCARVVGDVLGKYHPHGDQSVYDALVRLVQSFSTRYPLLAGHGNFGSVDNDPPAAMRYTETRLASIGNEALLTQVGEATVDFVDNFDNSQQEPTILPAQLPFLLLNGSSGIAVGMATNIPPHNLGEVVDGLVALIDRPQLSDEKLMELIPGPDFPTGGEIIETDGINDAYSQGRGSIVMRGVAGIEEISTGQRRRTKTAIVISELPFQVSKAGWIEKVAAQVNNNKLDGISDIRDESDREGMRIVVELKRETDPQVVLHHLYQQTDLMCRFGSIFLTLVGGQPRQLTLKQILQEFLNFREETLIRQYTYELQETERRSHIVEGLLKALDFLDEVIEIIRNSPDGTTARSTLQEQLDLSEVQADAILAMPLRRLTGLERQKLRDEFAELQERIQQLRQLIEERPELLKALKKELRALKRKFSDERRTRIISREENENQEKQAAAASQNAKAQSDGILQALLPPDEETVVELTHRGYARRLSPKAAEAKARRNEENSGIMVENDDDFPVSNYSTMTSQNLVVVMRTGKVYPLNVGEIPPTSSRSKGTPLITLLPPSATKDAPVSRQELVLDHLLLDQYPEKTDLLSLTQQGKIKRLALSELIDLTNRGVTVVKLKDDDELSIVNLCQPGEQVVIASSGGRLLRFELDDQQLPVMGRTAQGSQATRLRKQEELIGCLTLDKAGGVLLVSEQGEVKQIPLGKLRKSNRGAIGTHVFQFSLPQDQLIGIVETNTERETYLLTNENRVIRFGAQDVLPTSSDKSHQPFGLKKGEKILLVKQQR